MGARDGVSNQRRLGCLLNRLFRRRSNKIAKPRVTGLCEGNSPVTGEFPSQRASNPENVSIWWRHHEFSRGCYVYRDRVWVVLNMAQTDAERHPSVCWHTSVRQLNQHMIEETDVNKWSYSNRLNGSTYMVDRKHTCKSKKRLNWSYFNYACVLYE